MMAGTEAVLTTVIMEVVFNNATHSCDDGWYRRYAYRLQVKSQIMITHEFHLLMLISKVKNMNVCRPGNKASWKESAFGQGAEQMWA